MFKILFILWYLIAGLEIASGGRLCRNEAALASKFYVMNGPDPGDCCTSYLCLPLEGFDVLGLEAG